MNARTDPEMMPLGHCQRTTTLKEGKLYCLLGIFGVYFPLIYGEGEAYAELVCEKKFKDDRRARAYKSYRTWPVC